MTYITEKSRAELMGYINEYVEVTGKLERICNKHCSILITDVVIKTFSDDSIFKYDHIWLGLRDSKQVHVSDTGKIVCYLGKVQGYHRDYAKDNVAWSVGNAINHDTWMRAMQTPMSALLRWELLRANLAIHHVIAITFSILYKSTNTLCSHIELSKAAIASIRILDKSCLKQHNSYLKQYNRSITYNKKLMKEIEPLFEAVEHNTGEYNPVYIDRIIKSYPYISDRAFERYQKEFEQFDLDNAMGQLQAMYSSH
ncbi:MAG: hypothetical protein AAGF83_20750 [Cyanobacteria bacterium P01_G01_bin.67]